MTDIYLIQSGGGKEISVDVGGRGGGGVAEGEMTVPEWEEGKKNNKERLAH